MTFNQQILDEIEQLKQMDILEKEDSIDSLQEDFYQCPEWPEEFWRRRSRHVRRPDPELPFIEKLKPRKVLEVGSAYGRVTRKILTIPIEEQFPDSSIEVTGLEINSYFQKYLSLYSKEYPELTKARFVFGDILEVRKVIPLEVFDVVVIPMNTVPNFPFDRLDDLFKNVNDITKKGGYFIFSVHNQKLSDDDLKKRKDLFGGELLVEKGKNPIAVIFYDFPIIKTTYGYFKSYYTIHHFLNKKMNSERKIISRSVMEFVNPDTWEKIITKNGFIIDFYKDQTFSKVYGLKKRKIID